MGAFFLVNKNLNYNKSGVEAIFSSKGFKQLNVFITDQWELYYYTKISFQQAQVFEVDKFKLICCGTFIYRSNNRTQSGKLLLNDLINGNFDKRQLLGTFACIYISEQLHLEIFTDSANIYNVFYDDTLNIFSSSFLAIKAARSHNTLNKFASLESILTGNIIGKETLINEINRLEPDFEVSRNDLHLKVLPALKYQAMFEGNFRQAVDYQLDVLSSYFSASKAFANEHGVDSGITSGFDSRLMLALIIKYWDNFQLHSHYRKTKDREIEIAENVARTVNKETIKVPVKYPLELSSEEFDKQLNQSFLFCDGLIRMHGYWIEEYNTINHRISVLNTKQLGVSGIGGEQYRNTDNNLFNRYFWRNFIKYDTLLFLSGSCFLKKNKQDEIIDYISNKAATKLGITGSGYVTKLEIKRYWNEVFIPSRLGGRNNSENQISFFLSPFTENYVSSAAYEIIPYLGLSNAFQMAMINNINPILASVDSDYGYAFNSSIPLKYSAKHLIQAILPNKLELYRRELAINRNGKTNWDEISHKRHILKQYLNEFDGLGLPVDSNYLTKRPDIWPLLIQLVYFNKNI